MDEFDYHVRAGNLPSLLPEAAEIDVDPWVQLGAVLVSIADRAKALEALSHECRRTSRLYRGAHPPAPLRAVHLAISVLVELREVRREELRAHLHNDSASFCELRLADLARIILIHQLEELLHEVARLRAHRGARGVLELVLRDLSRSPISFVRGRKLLNAASLFYGE